MGHRSLTRGKRMELARIAHNLTQSALSAEVGVSHSSISHFEHNVDPGFMEMVRICRRLGIPLDEMAGLEDPDSITITFGARPKPEGPRDSA